MSDHAPESTPPLPAATQDDAIDQSRRKLNGAALGVAAVFTLASRPVWANQCTISGMASGNLSKPHETCEGCTPGYWFECQHLDSWVPTSFKPDDKFNTVFRVDDYKDGMGNPYTLLDVMGGIHGNMNHGTQGSYGSGGGNDGGSTCSLLPNGYVNNPMQKDPLFPNLGFHAVAALLNAAHPNVNYGYTAGEIIDLFRSNLHRAESLKNSLDMLNNRGCPLN